MKIKCVYSKEDGEYVATCKEKYPHLSWMEYAPEKAIKGFKQLIKETKKDYPVYQNTCARCGDKFDTYHKNFKFCPACEEEYKDERSERQKRWNR